ncbi:MAG: M50 family metallopeptidase [Fimbriimonas sp.]
MGLVLNAPKAAVVIFASLVIVVFVTTIMVVSVLLAILVHEVGHVLAGRRAGFDFRTLKVGPFEWRREGDRTKFGRAPRMRGIGGMVRMLPQGRDDLARRLGIFIAGGPIASVAWCLATFGLYRYALSLHLQNSVAGSVLYLVSFGLFSTGLVLIVGTVLPFSARNGSATDMKLLLALRGKPEDQGRIVAWFLLAKELLGGVRARDWSADLLDQARFPEDGSDGQVRAEYLLYLYHLDRGDLAQARAWLTQAMPNAERLNKGHMIRECVFLEAAFLAAWFDRDLPEAERLRKLAGKENELLKGTRARVDAAIAARQGNATQALMLAQESETRLREHSRRYGGDVEAELELIEAIRDDVRA